MNQKIHLLVLPLQFPTGLAAGAGGEYNRLHLARNGRGQPVLRGTALAGVLRHAYCREMGLTSSDKSVAKFFGEALDGEAHGKPSAFRINDCILETGGSSSVERTHHLRNRHSKTVAEGGLFSMESCPPGTSTTAYLWLTENAEGNGSKEFLSRIVAIINSGICLGGQSARGIGIMQLSSDAKLRTFNLSDIEEHVAMLDIDHQLRSSPNFTIHGASSLTGLVADRPVLQIELQLRVPRGQDILVGDGAGLERDTEPQRVTGANGKKYWRIPGSTFRGLFRAWITKLAAKAGKVVADSYDRRMKFSSSNSPRTDELNGENLGRCFLPEGQRSLVAPVIECPIASLFGSLYQSSRIHFSDALVDADASGSKYSEQARMHVAVDRITGGAAESLLFNNSVLTYSEVDCSEPFLVKIRVDRPTLEEIDWIKKTIVALDIGILRVGSSKSSGRLELHRSPTATGIFADVISSIQPHPNFMASHSKSAGVQS